MATLPLAWVRGARRPRGGRRIVRAVWIQMMFAGRVWWFAVIWLAIATCYLGHAVVRLPTYDRTGEAVVTHVARWGKDGSSRPVYAVDYAFTGRTGTSYTDDPPWTNEPREVEYVRDDPSRSRLVGMRSRPYDRIGGLAALFAAMAMIAMLVARLAHNVVRLRILRFGEVGVAVVLTREAIRRARPPRWRLELAGIAEGERRSVVVDRAPAGTEVTTVSDRGRVVVLEALPGEPRIVGDAIVGDAYMAPVYLAAPALVVALIVVQLVAIIG